MVKKRILNPKPILDEELLLEAFAENGIPAKHAATIWRNLIQKGMMNFGSLPIPKAAKDLIENEFTPITSKLISTSETNDKSTTKLLIELQDGQRIESVIMRYGNVEIDSFPEDMKQKDEDATGTMDLLANLRAGEILEQLYHANKIEKIRNVVFMGMGEPLDNYDAVCSAVHGMIDTGRFSLSPSRVSVSTVGVVPRMKQLISDLPDIGLALSLHAPTQELRTQIVPSSKAWHIDRILKAADEFVANQNSKIKSNNRRRHILVEYVIIRDVNDSIETAHSLGKLLQGRDVLLNVIPYNPTAVPYDYKPPTLQTCREFVTICREEYKLHTLFRQEFGQDIASACGQLVIDSKSKCNEPIIDMEDLGSIGTQPAKRIKKREPKVVSKSRVEYYLGIAAFGLATAVFFRFVWKKSY